VHEYSSRVCMIYCADAAMLCTSKVVKREMHCSDVVGQTHTELMASVQYSQDPSFFSRVRVVSKWTKWTCAVLFSVVTAFVCIKLS